MRVLGIETCTRVGSMAIVDDRRVLAEVIVSESLRHAGAFEEALRKLTREAGLTEADMDAFAVGLGPGSFTGIRVGLAIAKGLALAFQKKIVGVGTLDAMAHQISVPHFHLCPIIPGEGPEIFGALFLREKDDLLVERGGFNVAVDQLERTIGKEVFVFGPGLEKHEAFFLDVLGREFIGPKDVFPRASMIAILAQNEKWAQNHPEPFYVKEPSVGADSSQSRDFKK